MSTRCSSLGTLWATLLFAVSLQSHQLYLVRPVPFGHNIISSVNHVRGTVVNSLSDVCLHQKSYNIDMLGFAVFIYASPLDSNTAAPTGWHQRKVQ